MPKKKPEPVFVPGELVEVRDKTHALYSRRFRIQHAVYQSWKDLRTGRYGERWKYKLPAPCENENFWWEEFELVKLDAKEDCEWIDCRWQPSRHASPRREEDDESED